MTIIISYILCLFHTILQVGYSQLALLEKTLMQDRPSSCSTSSSWPHTSPISPPRSLAEMQSCHRASSECIEEMSYSGVGVGAGDEESSRDISRSQVRMYRHFFFFIIIIFTFIFMFFI